MNNRFIRKFTELRYLFVNVTVKGTNSPPSFTRFLKFSNHYLRQKQALPQAEASLEIFKAYKIGQFMGIEWIKNVWA